MEKKISVVIPTYNRPHLLSNCIKALCNQTLSKNHYEIIVVSDGPDHNSENVIQQARAEQNVGIFFHSLEKKKGPAAARNLGWQNAHGNLIAFTDDDCLPDTNWLQAILEMYNSEELIAYTGKVIVPISEKPTDYELNTAGLETAEFVTANCICTKGALLKTGGFDEQFTTAWREDSDLHFKLMLNNIPILKNNKAVIIHPVRRPQWGVSIKEQKKSMFNALLYKKHPNLFRKRIKPKPSVHYYATTALFLLAVVLILLSVYQLALVSFICWLAFIIWFTTNRLLRTTKSLEHIFEMFVTSMFIPILSVFWSLYGSLKYRVLYL